MDGKDCKVNRDVERVLKEFHAAGKPVGCVALAGAGLHCGLVTAGWGVGGWAGARGPKPGTATLSRVLLKTGSLSWF